MRWLKSEGKFFENVFENFFANAKRGNLNQRNTKNNTIKIKMNKWKICNKRNKKKKFFLPQKAIISEEIKISAKVNWNNEFIKKNRRKKNNK